MRTYSQLIAANDIWDQTIGGDYLEILSSTGPIDISFFRSGAQLPLAEALQVDSGTYFRPAGGFDRWQIRTATLQTIKVGIVFGDGGTRRLSGAVTITGSVPVTGPLTDAQLRAAAVPVSLAAAQVIQQFVAPGAYWRSTAFLTAGTPDTIFSPASNANGAILYEAKALGYVNVGGIDFQRGFVQHTSAPAAFATGQLLTSADTNVQTAGAAQVQTQRLTKPVKIPAGYGLYFISDCTESSLTPSRHAWYTLL